MNGGQDLGGMHGLGPIEIEADEPLFHAPWERRVFALTLAMGARGDWNLDMTRHARENRSPADYLSSSYYEIWLKGLEQQLHEHGLVRREEVAARMAELAPGEGAEG
jgi:nitrile hydratase